MPIETDLNCLRLDARKSQYNELCDRWRDLDTKAQAWIALSGVLLSGFLAFTSVHRPTTCLDRLWFIGVVLLFAGSLVACAIELWIRSVMEAPHSKLIEEVYDDLSKKGKTDIDVDDIREELMIRWTDCNEEIQRVVKTKIVALIWGQVLTLGALSLIVVTAVVVFLT